MFFAKLRRKKIFIHSFSSFTRYYFRLNHRSTHISYIVLKSKKKWINLFEKAYLFWVDIVRKFIRVSSDLWLNNFVQRQFVIKTIESLNKKTTDDINKFNVKINTELIWRHHLGIEYQRYFTVSYLNSKFCTIYQHHHKFRVNLTSAREGSPAELGVREYPRQG